MSLSNEKIAEWIGDNISNDPTRYDFICSNVTVHSFKQIDNILEVEYSFWDDCHFDSSNQENFLFEINIGKEYGVNFPKHLDHISCKDIYKWPTASDCEQLKSNFTDVEEEIAEIRNLTWNDYETEQFIDVYFADIDKASMAEMLINEYNAKESIPSFIPTRLIPYFQKIISDYLLDALSSTK